MAILTIAYRDKIKRAKAEYLKQYRLEHKAEIAEHDRQYYLGHKAEIAKYGKLYLQKHRIQIGEQHKLYHRRIQREILTHYGNGQCACVRCGLNDIRALSIDHINGNGRKHRQELNIAAGYKFYFWLRKQGYPQEYQTLCMKCQFISRAESMGRGDSG